LLLFSGTVDEYRLLERMNRATLSKYTEMKEISSHLTKAMADLKLKCTQCLKNFFKVLELLNVLFALRKGLQAVKLAHTLVCSS